MHTSESVTSLDTSVQDFLKLVDENESFLVVSHTYPDGDAVGSTLAMGLLLEKLGKKVTFYNQHPLPFNFGFLPAADRWVNELTEAQKDIDVTVILDCAQLHRIGDDLETRGVLGKKIAVVDHHKTWDSDFAEVYVRDVSAAATGEVIYRILVASTAELDLEIAKCLYCCVLTDTGSFRYSSTSPTTFQIAGELLKVGINPWDMTSQIYESQPVEKMKLLGKSLSTLNVSDSGNLASIRLERQMFRDVLGPDFELMDFTSFTDGFINHARSIAGVEIAAQLFEEAATDEQSTPSWKISFRSRGSVNAAELAGQFGGGGNHNAAGCTILGSADSVHAQLAEALDRLVDAQGE